MPGTKKQFPPPLPLYRLLGPSFIMLALGLGSGELILWPYLSANFGLGIAWGAVAGITLQYFMNMEIERYALLKGESVFVGIYRLFPRAAYWFILSTFAGFALPGIIGSSAEVLAHVLGIGNHRLLAIGGLIVIGVLLSVARHIYPFVERFTKTLIFIGVPGIVILTFLVSGRADWLDLARGVVGQGDGYWFFPAGISLATFLGAFAYSGAAGNLNLAQSMYVKEKGYGMGAYAEKLSGLRGTRSERSVVLTGTDFEYSPENLGRFKIWWRRINIEHGSIFLGLGALVMCLLMLLSHVTTHGHPTNIEGIRFVMNEGAALGKLTAPYIGMVFLAIVAVMLFQTQMSVFDSTSRIMAENWGLKRLRNNLDRPIDLSRYYFVFLWLQIAVGVVFLGFNIGSTRALLVTGAVANAVAMFVHIALVNWTNYRTLPSAVQPGLIRRAVVLIAFGTFGVLSILTLFDVLKKSI